MEMLARPTVLSIVPASAKLLFLLVLVGGNVAESRVWDGVRDLRRGGITSLDCSSGEGGVGEALGRLALALLFCDSAGSLSLSTVAIAGESSAAEVSEEAEVPEGCRGGSWFAVGDNGGMVS